MGRLLMAATFAIVLSACEASPFRGVGAVFVPTATATTTPVLVASLSQPIRPIGVLAFDAFPCATDGRFLGVFDVALTASAAIDVDHVTIHLIDGTNVGGPIVTIPRPSLISQLGTAHVVAGSTVILRLQPQLQCGTLPLQGVSADIFFLDVRGVSHTITVVTMTA